MRNTRYGIQEQSIDQMRRFERLYERYLRAAARAIPMDDFTEGDMRVAHELGFAREGGSGAWLAYRLGLDEGYICRILKKLEAYGLATSRRVHRDRRVRAWSLTKLGREFATSIESDHRERVRLVLFDLQPDDQPLLVEAMKTIERILASALYGSRAPWPHGRGVAAGAAATPGAARDGSSPRAGRHR
jgi:DNA-binding MarR family transcriptional regulator